MSTFRNGATANEPLRILWEPEEDRPAFDFDIDAFRKRVMDWVMAERAVPLRSATPNELWRVLDPMRGLVDTLAKEIPSISPMSAHTGGVPAQPSSGDFQLDAVIGALWRQLSFVLSEAGRRSNDWPNAAAMWDHRLPAAGMADNVRDGWLAAVMSDHWSDTVMWVCQAVAQAVEPGGAPDPRIVQAAAETSAALDRLPQSSATIEGTWQRLEDLLSLPIWRQRHELYSAWMMTVLVRELALDAEVHVHTPDGVLALSFRGTHVATVSRSDGVLQLWAERRVPCTAPRGKGRKGGVQPDWTVVWRPVDGVPTDQLVVECKQYERPGRRNFADALADYARAHQQARVLLANYGPVQDDLPGDVPEVDRHRTQAFGYVHPGAPDSLAVFRAAVRASLPTRHDRKTALEHCKSPGAPANIALRIAEAMDLQLHVRVYHDDEVRHHWSLVPYRQSDGEGGERFLFNFFDVTARDGRRDALARVEVWVFRPIVRRRCSLPAGWVLLEVHDDVRKGDPMSVGCPVLAPGAWWHAVTFPGDGQRFEMPGTVTEIDPRESGDVEVFH